MIKKNFSFRSADGLNIYVYKWLPAGQIKATVNIAHGMAENAARYERLAEVLSDNGYAVYAQDLRGHGRTIGDPVHLGEAGADALNRMLADVHQLSDIIRNEIPANPLFLFGHSMGSFLVQGYISCWGSELQGAILSGSSRTSGILTAAGRLIAFIETLRLGLPGKSKLLNALSFGSFNKQFKPARTDFDWLSRDNAEVDKYIADPFCGGIFPAAFFYDLFGFLRKINSRTMLMRVPQNLPLYFFSGSCDPVGSDTKGVRKLIEDYKKAGMKDLTFKFYRDGRHEMLNELNREEVMTDLVHWLNIHC